MSCQQVREIDSYSVSSATSSPQATIGRDNNVGLWSSRNITTFLANTAVCGGTYSRVIYQRVITRLKEICDSIQRSTMPVACSNGGASTSPPIGQLSNSSATQFKQLVVSSKQNSQSAISLHQLMDDCYIICAKVARGCVNP